MTQLWVEVSETQDLPKLYWIPKYINHYRKLQLQIFITSRLDVCNSLQYEFHEVTLSQVQ